MNVKLWHELLYLKFILCCWVIICWEVHVHAYRIQQIIIKQRIRHEKSITDTTTLRRSPPFLFSVWGYEVCQIELCLESRVRNRRTISTNWQTNIMWNGNTLCLIEIQRRLSRGQWINWIVISFEFWLQLYNLGPYYTPDNCGPLNGFLSVRTDAL